MSGKARFPILTSRIWFALGVSFLCLAGAAHAQGDPSLPASELKRFAQGLGIPVSEAGERVGWQQRAPALQRDVRRRLGSSFAGVWVDTAAGGRIKLGIVEPAADLREKAQASVTELDLAGAVDVVGVRHSMQELEAIFDRLSGRLEDANEGATSPLAFGIRTDRNSIEISLPQGAALTSRQRELVNEARQRHGDAIGIGFYEGRARSRACTYPYCDPPLRGGVRISMSGRGACTGSFVARGRGADRNIYQLTAGHCGIIVGTGTWGTLLRSGGAFQAIGSWIDGYVQSWGDAGKYRVLDDGAWRARPWVMAPPNEASPIHSQTEPVVGQTVCASGALYGSTSCGTVREVHHEVTDGGVRMTLVRATFCGVVGDSGAPVHYNGVAFGLEQGGYSTCDSFFTRIQAAEDGVNADMIHAGYFQLRNSNSAGSADLAFASYEIANDPPIAGDWNRDGTDSIGTYHPSDRMFSLKDANSFGPSDHVAVYGLIPAIPIAGDWDRDGRDTIGLYDPNSTDVALNNANDTSGADVYFQFGARGDIPVVGDWDGDGDTTIGVYRPSTRTFYLRNSNSAGAADYTFVYGLIAATPIAGDWDGDGDDTIGLYDPSTRDFALNNVNDTSGADLYFTFGADAHAPVVGDWNRDGRDTIGVYAK